MAVFSKDAVAAALDQLSQTLDEAKGGGKEKTEEEKEDEGNCVNGVHAPQIIIPLVLEQYLEGIAKTGNALLPWAKLKPLIILKLEKVIENVTNEEEDLSFLDEKIQVSASDGSPLSGGDGDPSSIHILKMKKRIISALNHFQGIPFTIQRLCELLTQPKTYYKRIDKLLRGLEKNVRIVRTISPLLPAPPPPPPPIPINASLSSSSASAEASNNSDSFIIKATASTSSASTSSSPLSNSEKQEVNLPASSSSSSFSASALDPSQFATHSTKVADGLNFNGARESLLADADVEMSTDKSEDEEKMDDAESGGGVGGCDGVSPISNAESNQNDVGMVDQLTKFSDKEEKGQERVTVQSNSTEVAEIRGRNLSDAKEDEMKGENADKSREGASKNHELESPPKEIENGTTDLGVEEEQDKSGSEIHPYSSVDYGNPVSANDENLASVSSDSLEEVAETELTTSATELSSPMKRKRSIDPSGSGEEEEEPPLKRNSPDIEGDLIETKGEGDEVQGLEAKADDSTANGERPAELDAA